MRLAKTNKGFTGIEGVLVIVTLVAIGAAGYFAYQARTAKSATTATPIAATKSTGATTNSDPYAGWKTYTSSARGASFKYPASWKAEEIDDPQAEASVDKNVTLTGPNGLALIYSDNVSGLGGGCGDDSPHEILSSATKTTSGLYEVEDVGTIGLADAHSWALAPAGSLDTGTCLFYPLVTSKSDTKVRMQLSSYIEMHGRAYTFSSEEQKDLPQARLILKSFTY